MNQQLIVKCHILAIRRFGQDSQEVVL